MKLDETKIKEKFKPFKVVIETEEELVALWHYCNKGAGTTLERYVKEDIKKHKKKMTSGKICNIKDDLWSILNRKIEKLGVII